MKDPEDSSIINDGIEHSAATGGAEDQVENVLEVRHLKVQFPLSGGRVRKAVNDVSFDVPKGMVTCLVGESGSGKSVTALSLLNMVPSPGSIISGEVLFEGRDLLTLDKRSLKEIRGAGISIIFQEPMHAMDPVIAIGAQLVEIIRAHSQVDKQQARAQAIEWLGRVGLPHPERVFGSYPHELSGGMLQRVMIAMALSSHPKLLIADEPTTALDVTVQSQILDLLLELKKEYGLSVLFITHDFGVVAQIADNVSVMYAGRLLEQAPVDELFSHPRHPYTAGLLRTRPVIGSKARRLYSLHDQFPDPAELTDGTWDNDDWDEIMKVYRENHALKETERGNAMSEVRSEEAGSSADSSVKDEGPALLKVSHLKRFFVHRSGIFNQKKEVVKGVNDVSFVIHSGEAVGLVGESGSGKTTLGQTILNLQRATDGKVWFRGEEIGQMRKADMRRLRPQMQYIFQDPYASLNPRMTIGQSIGNPLLSHGLATRNNVREQVSRILKVCGLEGDILDRYPYEFSGGQRQRIVIARAMALKPSLVVADEPVASLDVSIQAQVINLFSDLRELERTAFLFISHDLSVVEHLCDRIIIMYLGAVVESGSVDEIFSDPRHPYTKELLSAIPVMDPSRRNLRDRKKLNADSDHRPYAEAIREGKMLPKMECVGGQHWVRSWQ